MRNISQFVASLVLLATQANVGALSTNAAADSSSPTNSAVLEVRLNTNTPQAIEISGPKQPDYDNEVLKPLRERQAAEAAQRLAAAKAAAARKVTARTVTVRTTTTQAPPTAENWAKLRYCEAGGIYTRNSGNGYYGAYQFNIGTWANYGGYSRPDLAPPAVQDAKAQATQAARGWSPWPACSRKLGLM